MARTRPFSSKGGEAGDGAPPTAGVAPAAGGLRTAGAFDADRIAALVDATAAPPDTEAGDREQEAAGGPAVTPPGGPPESDASTPAGLALFAGWVVVGLLVAGAVVGWIAAGVADEPVLDQDPGRWRALAFALSVIGGGLLLLQLIGRSSGYGVFRPVVGSDNRVSTSLTQLAVWTVTLVTTLAFLTGRVLFEDQAFATVVPGERWDEYLLLLGGPFAAAVIAKGTVTYKLSQGTMQKSTAVEASPAQVVTGDSGSADLVDAQYLLFNLVALGYLVVALVRTPVLPEMPSTLLALTGATAAGYVANKAAVRNAPRITSVSPAVVNVGDWVTVYGANFDPADAADPDRRIFVTLTGYDDSLYSTQSSDTYVRVRIPPTATAGHQQLTVTSTAGFATEAHHVEIRATAATVVGLDGADPLRPGRAAVLSGRNLGHDGDQLAVIVAGHAAVGTVGGGGTEVRFTVPTSVAAVTDTQAEVRVEVPGRDAVTRTLPLEQPRVRSVVRVDGALDVDTEGVAPREGATTAAPTVTVNGLAAPEPAAGRADGVYRVTPPAGVPLDGALVVQVVDGLGRTSPGWRLPAIAEVTAG